MGEIACNWMIWKYFTEGMIPEMDYERWMRIFKYRDRKLKQMDHHESKYVGRK